MSPVTLSQLYIYPIKSMAGIALPTAVVEARGLQHDRRWMLVDQAGRFMTQRQYPQMALIKVSLTTSHLLLRAPTMPPLAVPFEPPHQTVMSVQVWRDVCGAIPLADDISKWFRTFLQVRCQLVYMPEPCDRTVDHERVAADQPVSFADGFPFLLISQGSLDDLNQRLEQPVPMNRFRPNLVVEGCEALAEDTWRQIRIGEVGFQVVKPCSRCGITTVDQGTAEVGQEPLKTLATYRRWDGKIWFGQNLVHEQLGTLTVGDGVEVLDTQSAPL
jgi:hypothetical protein